MSFIFNLAGLPNDVNGGIPNFARIYNSMPVLEDGLSSGHASDTENNNPNTGSNGGGIGGGGGGSGTNNISMLMDQCKIVDATTTNDKYIDSVLDTSQTLISTIQSSVSNSKLTTRNGTSNMTTPTLMMSNNSYIGCGGGNLGLDILTDTGDTTCLRKENLLVNSSPVASQISVTPQLVAQNALLSTTTTSTPILSSATANLMVKQRQVAAATTTTSNLNIISTVGGVNSQNTSPSAACTNSTIVALHTNVEREKDITNQIIQNNLNNKQQQQQNITKNNDIDLDTLYSISK